MSARMTILAAMPLMVVALLHASAGTAAGECASALAQFEAIIASDVETGNLNKGVHRRIVGALAGVKASCSAGRDAEASRTLAAVKARHGYR